MDDKILKSIKLLKENGYVVKKLTKGQIADSKKCDEDMDCTSCRCSCCIMQ